MCNGDISGVLRGLGDKVYGLISSRDFGSEILVIN